MRHVIKTAFLVIFILATSSPLARAAAGGEKTVSGIVTSLGESQISFKSTSGAYYTANIALAKLIRKYGADMEVSDIIVGDKIQATGRVWADNSITASSVRDMSLYVHTGSFSGKIISTSPATNSFIMQSRQWGTQTVHSNDYTIFKINGSPAILADLRPDMNILVKGNWDRTRAELAAQQALASVRLINIDVTGNLVLRGDTALTIVSNNVIYGIDIAKAKLQSKNGTVLSSSSQFNMSDNLRVHGKHISGSVGIIAETVKDLSLNK